MGLPTWTSAKEPPHPPCLARRWHLDQPPALHVIDIAVDRHVAGHERMRPDAPDVAGDALRLVLDGQPVDEVAFGGARPRADVVPAVRLELRGVQALPRAGRASSRR